MTFAEELREIVIAKNPELVAELKELLLAEAQSGNRFVSLPLKFHEPSCICWTIKEDLNPMETKIDGDINEFNVCW